MHCNFISKTFSFTLSLRCNHCNVKLNMNMIVNINMNINILIVNRSIEYEEKYEHIFIDLNNYT